MAVDSTPKLHGIWDTINSTLATAGPPTRLPPEFYNCKARNIIDRIVTEEEYSGFKDSVEYRTIGIGALLGDAVQRMVRSSQEKEPKASSYEGSDMRDDLGFHKSLKVALFGCHDSTLAAILASLGALEDENNTWPSYTSSLSIELFRDIEQADVQQHRIEPVGMLAHDLQYYVRVRYNDCPITIPGCRPKGRHLDGDKSLCTLVSSRTSSI